MAIRFRDRKAAGECLAQHLYPYQNQANLIVLGLPRGGIPVAYEIARTLQANLDVCLVRKLGVPSHPELAMGAIALDGIRILNHTLIETLGISSQEVETVTTQAQQELTRQNQCYRQGRPYPDLSDQTIVLVDDGLATGSSMQAALAFLRKQQPRAIIVAVPIAATAPSSLIEQEVDQVICLYQSDHLMAISHWYDDFSALTDTQVQSQLAQGNFKIMTNGTPPI
ncbi:MAG: phosphoribosyltransferase [Acaryochloris sp. RU_4_1]|nr:phosphoribosyltransferase [Acaryochloris sp. SU_5_25]NJM64495.1 phosphoribosyltransferase [Acaryochloris sp. RU_4_1]NJR53389.1 phosphoribosyltransferase [Acaryochloris sp. CRU_2_0]